MGITGETYLGTDTERDPELADRVVKWGQTGPDSRPEQRMFKPVFRGGPMSSIVAILFAAGLSSAATPNPPASMCIDGKCAAATGTSAVSGRAVKWHPGIYAYYTPGSASGGPGHRWDLPAQRTQLLGFIDSICSETAIKGISIIPVWRTLEGDTAGDYSAGFAAVDAVLAKLTSCNKYLMLNLQAAWFGNIGSQYELYPRYVVDGSSLGVTYFTPATGSTARVWQAATADRLIALSAAYGNRYNGNRNFEMMTIYGETALQLGGQDGYSTEALATQIKRTYAAARGHWPNTGLKLFVNDLGSDASWVDLYNVLKQYYVSPSNPDTWPGDITTSDRMFVGKNAAGQDVHEDLRDKLPWTANVDWQSFNLSGNTPRWSLQQLWDVHHSGYSPANGDFHMPALKARYAAWYVNQSNGNAQNQWSTAELPFLRERASIFTTAACPTAYPACTSN
jgi:hypothetical protein